LSEKEVAFNKKAMTIALHVHNDRYHVMI